jgi:hypothetical protein
MLNILLNILWRAEKGEREEGNIALHCIILFYIDIIT